MDLSPSRRKTWEAERGLSVYISLGTLFIFLIVIFTFFTGYNHFLVDKAIGNLEQSLSEVANAQTAEDMKSLRFFLDDMLVSELSDKKFEAKQYSGIEFSKGVIFEAKDYRQIKDVKYVLEDVLNDRKKRRNQILKTLDHILLMIKGWFGLGGKLTLPGVSVRKGRDLTLEEKKAYSQAKSDDDHWEITKAIQGYETLLVKAPGSKTIVDIELDLSYAYAKVGRYDKAQSLLERVKSENGRGSKEAAIADTVLKKIQGLTLVLQERAKLESQISQVKEVYELQQLYFKVGVMSYKLFDLRKAEESFRNAAAIAPESQQALKALFYFGLTLKYHGKYKQSAEAFEEIMDRFPKSEYASYAQYQLADAFQKAGDFERAAQQFQDLSFNHPQTNISALSQFRAGYVYFYDMGDPVRASGAFEKLKQNFSSDGLSKYSNIEVSPFVRSTFRDYGFNLLKAGVYEQAKEAFMSAIHDDPKDSWSYSGLATAKCILGEDEQETLQIAEQAVKVGSDAYTIGTLGFVHDIQSNTDEAIKGYEKALTIKKDYPVFIYNVARLYSEKGEYEKAMKTYTELISNLNKDTPWPEPYNNLGHVYWKQEKYPEAIQSFRKALELKPGLLEARYNLALAYEKNEDYDLAEEEYEEVLKLDRTFRKAKQGIKRLRNYEKSGQKTAA